MKNNKQQQHCTQVSLGKIDQPASFAHVIWAGVFFSGVLYPLECVFGNKTSQTFERHSVQTNVIMLHKYWQRDRCVSLSTDSTKINRPEHTIRKYWTNFRQPTAHLQQDIFGKILIEVGSLHLYASFGTFCVQIGQLFAPQRVFKHSEEFRNRRHFPSRQPIVDFQTYFKDSLCLE